MWPLIEERAAVKPFAQQGTVAGTAVISPFQAP
jgi:hypothetical protein